LVRLKAVVKDSMVGFIGGERDSGRRRGWVTTLCVLPEYRRQGIGIALLAKCEELLATPVIRLSVRASNHGAVGLYEQAGYKLVDRRKKYYAGGEDALVFEKSR
jgi:ribosomal-protein-alanine N-acetyltransferase